MIGTLTAATASNGSSAATRSGTIAQSSTGSGFETIRSIKPLPVELWAIVPLLVAALLPLLAVAAVKVPIIELLKKILGALV